MSFENWNRFLRNTIGERFIEPGKNTPPPKIKQQEVGAEWDAKASSSHKNLKN